MVTRKQAVKQLNTIKALRKMSKSPMENKNETM